MIFAGMNIHSRKEAKIMSNISNEKIDDLVWEEYDKFKEDYKLSLKNNKRFSDIVKAIMNEKDLTIEKLSQKSNISVKTINNMRSGEITNKYREKREYIPLYKTIIAFCIACDLDMLNTITLLESVGLSFRKTNMTHYAYCYLVVNYRGKEIDECNKVLNNFNIREEDFLGEAKYSRKGSNIGI